MEYREQRRELVQEERTQMANPEVRDKPQNPLELADLLERGIGK